MLFAIANEIEIPDKEEHKIDGLLHPSGENLFLSDALDSVYWFDYPEGNLDDDKQEEESFEIIYGGNGMILPVEGLTEGSKVTVTVSEQNSNEETVFDDWEIDKVERGKSKEVSDFEVSFSSNKAADYSWNPGETILIDIIPQEGVDLPGGHYEYTTKGTKDNWYDYLKFWEGHKNNWYDYMKVWENSVEFERVK